MSDQSKALDNAIKTVIGMRLQKQGSLSDEPDNNTWLRRLTTRIKESNLSNADKKQ